MFYWFFSLLMINSCIQPAHVRCSISLDRDLPKTNVSCPVPDCLVHRDLDDKTKVSKSTSVRSAGDQCCKGWGQHGQPGWDIPSLGQGKTSLACGAGVLRGVPSWGQRCVGGTTPPPLPHKPVPRASGGASPILNKKCFLSSSKPICNCNLPWLSLLWEFWI